MENMVVDSTVFIQFFRNNVKAKEFLLNPIEKLQASRVTAMEIQAGVRNKAGAIMAEKQIIELGVEILEVNEEVSEQAGEIFRDYFHTGGIGLIDSFIAATAKVGGQKLATHNMKHFKFIKGLDLILPY